MKHISHKPKFIKYIQKLFNVPEGKAQRLAQEFNRTQYISHIKSDGTRIEIKGAKIHLSKVKQEIANL